MGPPANFDAFFRPSTLKTEKRVGYVYIEESFDTIFNMGYGGGRTTPEPTMDYGSGKSPMVERVKNSCVPMKNSFCACRGSDEGI